MRTRTYNLQGKEVPTQLRGAAITFPVPETLDDVRSLVNGGEEANVIELASGAYDVWLQGRVRAYAAGKNEDGSARTTQQVQAFASGLRYQRRVEGQGSRGEAKPQTKVQRAASGAGNKLFEKMAASPAFRDQMFEALDNRAEFEAWVAARKEAAAPAAAPAPASTPPTSDAPRRRPQGATK